MTEVRTLDRVVIRFAGDSGDGMQLTGDRFTADSAVFGNDISTLPNFPAEIRAPAGTLPGVSSFQLHFANYDIMTPGDRPDVLVAMNPAALKANIADVPRGGLIIADTADFTAALAAGLNNGVQAITDLGGAKEGDNTLVDALAPAARSAKDSRGSVQEVLELVFGPAVEGAKSTRGMQAKKGRASYLGESAKDVPDPGAIAVTWLFGDAAVDEF